MKIINKVGYEAFVVGGMVRDIIMGDKNPDDFDIATNMPINIMKQISQEKAYRFLSGKLPQFHLFQI